MLTVADVLTAEEVAAQPFAGGSPLAYPWMPKAVSSAFERMSNDERRAYVLAATECAMRSRWSLQYALAVLVERALDAPSSPVGGRP